MRVQLDCFPCLQRQALQAARFVTDDQRIQREVLAKTMEFLLQNINMEMTTKELSSEIQQMVRDITNSQDPYLSVKKECNDMAIGLYDQLKETIDSSLDPLLTAVKIAIAGNIIDFGAKESFNITKTIDNVLKRPFALDAYSEFKEDLIRAQTIAYISDNTGEIVFDKLLLETIMTVIGTKKVTFVVKRRPSLNDAMIDDAISIGLNTIPGLTFYEVDPAGHDSNYLAMLKKYDIVISKGQANFEDLYSESFIYFLLIVKCSIVAQLLRVPINSSILIKNVQTNKDSFE